MRRERGASGERGAPAAVERDREKSVRKEKAERTVIDAGERYFPLHFAFQPFLNMLFTYSYSRYAK
jgi:hypothetical protein